MANQTITTAVNYDDASISGLLDGETITIDAGALTINADARYNQQAAVPGNITISSTLGGSVTIDGTQVWELYFDASTGNVPTQAALGSNGVTGTGGASGELTRVWATGSLTPEAAGGAMPATGWIKLRSKTGNFADNEVVTLPGGATITLTGPGRRSWIELPGAKAAALTVPGLGNATITGDWYELGTTNGADDQQIQLPLAFEVPALQVETSAGSGVYEWWNNASVRWIGQFNQNINLTTAVTIVNDATSGAAPAYHHGRRIVETTANSVHVVQTTSVPGVQVAQTNVVFSAYIKKSTRRYCVVQLSLNNGSTRYGALVDLDTGTIIANPAVGSPSSPASSITAINNDWYLVTVSANKVDNNAVQGNVGTSNSSTPTYSNGLPTFAGSTAESLFVGDMALTNGHNTQYVSSSDARGKFYYSNPNTGLITFAQRTNGTQGLKPPTGCKIRVPNIFLTSAGPANWAQNEWNYTPASSNYTCAISNSPYIADKITSYWRTSTTPLSLNWTNSCYSNLHQLQGLIGASTVNNCAFSSTIGALTTRLSFNSALAPISLTNCRFAKAGSSTAVAFTFCSDVTVTSCNIESFSDALGITSRNNNIALINVQSSATVAINNCVIIGGFVQIQACTDVTIKNVYYSDLINGTSVAGGAQSVVAINASTDCLVDGIYPYLSLTGTNPVESFIKLESFLDSITVRNVGTVTSPWNCSPTNVASVVEASLAIGKNFDFRRMYVDGTSSTGLNEIKTAQQITATNVWADGADTQVHLFHTSVYKGCRWTVTSTPQTGVFGTHWDEGFLSTTAGRFTILANEPTTDSASQCVGTFTGLAGFTGTGSISLPGINDTVTWIYPDYALGHVSIANQTGGTAVFNVIGTNTQAFEFDYQIDKNTGTFSAWKHLVNSARQASGGSTGTNSVVINTSDESALIRKPQINDYVQSASLRLPAGTTITNVSGTTITTSGNFTTDLTAGELLYFWKDIASEAISPSTGFKLKVRIKVNATSTSNLFSYLTIPTDTNSTDYKIQYPLPFDANGVISGLQAGSRVQIFNVNTLTELYNATVTGTSYTYGYYEGVNVTAGDVIRVRIAKLGFLPQTILATATLSGFSVTGNAFEDTIYTANGIDGSTVTEFVADYPNIQIDISDDNGLTTVQRIYAWLRYVETTSSGIAEWFNVVTPTDDVNYLIDTDLVDLRLDNTTAIPVRIIGGRLYRSDEATIIADTSGSIQMDPNRVYVADAIANRQESYDAVADTVLRRSTANVEASTFGNLPSLRSLYGMVAQATHNTFVNVNNKLVVTKSDESTQLATRTITNSPNAQPITGLDSD